MKVKWFAHASFLIEGDGLRIITDPYTPAEIGAGVITESADIVIRSSDDDLGHNDAEMITGNPVVVTATDYGLGETTVKGLKISTIPAEESHIYKEIPKDCSMYCFDVEGIRFGHMGDIGNPLKDWQIDGLRGVDVLLALTGGPPTLDLSDLHHVIDVIKPRVVIPMHYALPGLTFKMLPVTEFTNRFPAQAVRWVDSCEGELTRATLPEPTQVIVLKPGTA